MKSTLRRVHEHFKSVFTLDDEGVSGHFWSEVPTFGCKITEQVDQRQHILLTQLAN